MAIVTFVLRLTPYGVLAIMANTLSTVTLAPFGLLKILNRIVRCINYDVYHSLNYFSLLGISPIRYIKKTYEVLIFAFITLKRGYLTTECTNTKQDV